MQKKILQTMIFIFWDFLMFCQIFLSPQVKRLAIITYKHSIYELTHELPNDLRLRMLDVKPHGIFAAGGAFVPTQEKKDLGC